MTTTLATDQKPPKSPSPTGMEIFSATMHKERQLLGEWITRWLEANPQVRLVDKIVTQSSDSQFHCLTIVIVYTGKATTSARSVKP
jgi:hypothetical protein